MLKRFAQKLCALNRTKTNHELWTNTNTGDNGKLQREYTVMALPLLTLCFTTALFLLRAAVLLI